MKLPENGDFPPGYVSWVADCVILAANDSRVPDRFVWDLLDPDTWLYWANGFTPAATIEVVFGSRQ